MTNHSSPVKETPLLPCPFCGSKSVTISYFNQPATRLAASCLSCLAAGPVVDRYADPFAPWNTRSAPAQQPVSPVTEHPHVPAAFINAIADEGTKAEAIESLQKQWNENCALRAELKALRAPAQTQPNPVGWMAFCPTTGGRLFASKEQTASIEGRSIYAEHGFTVEPLYTAAPAQCAPMREALELIKKQVIERGGFTIERGSGAMTVIANALSSVTSTVQHNIEKTQGGAWRKISADEAVKLKAERANVDWIEGAGFVVYDAQALAETREQAARIAGITSTDREGGK